MSATTVSFEPRNAMKPVRIALPVPLYREFDYLVADPSLADIGRCVRVRLRTRRLLGVIVAIPSASDVPEESLLPIDSFADDVPRLPDDTLTLARFAAEYYKHPLGMALQHAIPPRGRRPAAQRVAPPSWLTLTPAGVSALASLPSRALQQRRLFAALTAKSALAR